MVSNTTRADELKALKTSIKRCTLLKGGWRLEVTNVAEGDVIQNYELRKTIHSSVPQPYALLKRFYSVTNYFVFDLEESSNKRAVL